MAERARLGRTGLAVSPVCFGTWQLSPKWWGAVAEDEIVRAVRRGFDLGINFFDTANAYGDGLAERVLGRAIADLPRGEMIVATKVFWHVLPDGSRYPDLSPEYIQEECEGALARLGVDYIDLFQCHSYDQLCDVAEVAAAMERLVRQGKIRHYGVSNWTAEQMRSGNARGNFATCQPPYSLIDRDAEKDVLPYCLTSDIGVLVWGPLHQGLLTGKYTGEETFSDFRKDRGEFTGEKFKKICQRVAQLRDIASAYQMSMVQFVIAATLMHRAVNCAIVGIKNVQHVEDAAGAMGKTISREDWHKARQLVTL